MSTITSQPAHFSTLISLISRIGADPSDSDDVRLKKFLFTASVLILAIPPSALLGLLYFVSDEPLAGLLLLAFSALSLVIVIILGLKPHQYPRLLFAELLVVLLIPFLVTLVLGGLNTTSLAILWSFMCPLGALVMTERSIAQRWFLSFMIVLVMVIALQPFLRPANNLSPLMSVIIAGLNIGGVSIVTFVLLNYFVGQRDLFQQRADDLLLNILPEEIANTLKKGNRTIAEQYDGVTVLFADVVDFTPMSAKMTPTELVELLNEVFSHFDSLVDKYGVEKIKTIGDCYMVASGVPRSRSDHAQALTYLALEMRDFISNNDIRGHKLAFRIGLNSGPAVAGVIGQKKFIYDLWGDTVNTASRMESNGKEGFIQVTDDTYELIKKDFVCEQRGAVEVKGKGNLNVWYVLDIKPQPEDLR